MKTIISTSTPHALTSQTTRNAFNQMSETFKYTYKRTVNIIFQSRSSISYSPSIKGTNRERSQKEIKATNPKGSKIAGYLNLSFDYLYRNVL